MNKPSQPDTRKGKYDRDGDRLRGAVDSAADLVSGAETSMTESRGAMTAQQFWPEWLKPHIDLEPQALLILFADALSAHNTAELRAQLEAKDVEIRELRQELRELCRPHIDWKDATS